MTNKKKKRARALSAKTGMSHQAAVNALESASGSNERQFSDPLALLDLLAKYLMETDHQVTPIADAYPVRREDGKIHLMPNAFYGFATHSVSTGENILWVISKTDFEFWEKLSYPRISDKEGTEIPQSLSCLDIGEKGKASLILTHFKTGQGRAVLAAALQGAADSCKQRGGSAISEEAFVASMINKYAVHTDARVCVYYLQPGDINVVQAKVGHALKSYDPDKGWTDHMSPRLVPLCDDYSFTENPDKLLKVLTELRPENGTVCFSVRDPGLNDPGFDFAILHVHWTSEVLEGSVPFGSAAHTVKWLAGELVKHRTRQHWVDAATVDFDGIDLHKELPLSALSFSESRIVTPEYNLQGEITELKPGPIKTVYDIPDQLLAQVEKAWKEMQKQAEGKPGFDPSRPVKGLKVDMALEYEGSEQQVRSKLEFPFERIEPAEEAEKNYRAHDTHFESIGNLLCDLLKYLIETPSTLLQNDNPVRRLIGFETVSLATKETIRWYIPLNNVREHAKCDNYPIELGVDFRSTLGKWLSSASGRTRLCQYLSDTATKYRPQPEDFPFETQVYETLKDFQHITRVLTQMVKRDDTYTLLECDDPVNAEVGFLLLRNFSLGRPAKHGNVTKECYFFHRVLGDLSTRKTIRHFKREEGSLSELFESLAEEPTLTRCDNPKTRQVGFAYYKNSHYYIVYVNVALLKGESDLKVKGLPFLEWRNNVSSDIMRLATQV